jgi:hypothetical protein
MSTTKSVPSSCEFGMNCPIFNRLDRDNSREKTDWDHCIAISHGPVPALPKPDDYDQLFETKQETPIFIPAPKAKGVSGVCPNGVKCSGYKREQKGKGTPSDFAHCKACTHDPPAPAAVAVVPAPVAGICTFGAKCSRHKRKQKGTGTPTDLAHCDACTH